MKLLQQLFFAALLLAGLSACYRMPTEEDYCLIPSVNNPDMTGGRGSTGMPGVPY